MNHGGSDEWPPPDLVDKSLNMFGKDNAVRKACINLIVPNGKYKQLGTRVGLLRCMFKMWFLYDVSNNTSLLPPCMGSSTLSNLTYTANIVGRRCIYI